MARSSRIQGMDKGFRIKDRSSPSPASPPPVQLGGLSVRRNDINVSSLRASAIAGFGSAGCRSAEMIKQTPQETSVSLGASSFVGQGPAG